jgi:hypothetical protein
VLCTTTTSDSSRTVSCQHARAGAAEAGHKNSGSLLQTDTNSCAKCQGIRHAGCQNLLLHGVAVEPWWLNS